MKHSFKSSIILLAFFGLSVGAHAQFSGSGTGTPADPYIITSATQLDEVRDDLTASYKLANDIDLTDFLAESTNGWQPIGDNSNSMANRFRGKFNGAGHKITGLWINRPTTDNVGLFGYTDNNTTIDSVGVEIAAAGIKGQQNTGGLVGNNNVATITNCYVTGNVTGSNNVGGLVGTNNVAAIANCYVTANVTGNNNVGGLVGTNKDKATIANCYATGNVSGNEKVGGLAGDNWGAAISNCYATGSVSGNSYVGGLVGYNTATVTNSFYDRQTSGQSDASKGTPKTTAEMKQQATFVDWDFDIVWGINENQTYPYLRWQYEYEPVAVAVINALIDNNSLAATKDDPASWIFAVWNNAAPKQLVQLNLTGINGGAGVVTGEVSLAGLSALQTLNIYYNSELTGLDVSDCTALTYMNCSVNALEELNVSGCTALKTLYANDNNLTTLDLSGNTALQLMHCYDNKITELDLSANTALTDYRGYGQTVSLTLTGNETNGYTFDIPLNNPTFSETAITYENASTLKSTDNSVTESDFTVQTGNTDFELSGTMTFVYDEVSGISDVLANQISIYPNPVKDELRIESGETAFGGSQLTITKMEILDVTGKVIYQFNNLRNQINVSALPQGIYFLKLETDKGITAKKLVKE